MTITSELRPPPLPPVDELLAATRSDCVEGLATHNFVVMEFLLLPPTDDLAAPIGNRSHTVFSWEVCAVQGEPPTQPDLWSQAQRTVELSAHAAHLNISGVTIVNHSHPQPERWTFERHIDWAALHSQLAACLG